MSLKITYEAKMFCRDYDCFNDNWEQICKMCKVDRQKVLLVGNMSSETIQECENLTKLGYCVRKDNEFQPCLSCGNLLMSKMSYDFVKSRNPTAPIPLQFIDTCSECINFSENV